MEALMNGLRRGGDDLTTARSLRLASRPPLNGIFEDHGQSLVSGSQHKKSADTVKWPISGNQKFKPAITTEKGKVGAATRSMTQGGSCTTARIVSARGNVDIELSDSQSEDEMDLLSSRRNTADDASTSKKRISRMQDDTDGGFVDEDGKYHPYLKDFQPKRDLFSTLKFKKNKAINNVKAKFSDIPLSQQTRPTSPLSPSRQHASSSRDGPTLGSSSKSKCHTSTSDGDTIYVNRPQSNKDPNSKSASRSQASKLGAVDEHPSDPKFSAENLKIGPPSRSVRSRIKQTNNPEGGKRQPNEPSTSKGQTSSPSVALDDALLDVGYRSTKRRPRSSRMSRSRSCERCSSPKVTIRKPQAFPNISPPRSASPASAKRQLDIFPRLSPLTGSISKLEADGLLRRQKRQINPFPMLSPPSKDDGVEVTRGRTLTKGKERGKEKGDASLHTPEDEDDATLSINLSSSLKNKAKGKERALPTTNGAKDNTRKKLKRFPMSAHMLQSINSSPSTMSPRGKRSSESSGDELISKRAKKESDPFSQSPTRGFEDEADSFLFSPEVDPLSLCPYCDTPLPENPSSLLLELIAATRRKANSDPRPSNPLGLKAPVAVFVTVCQRHRFESQILPEAEKKGWPKTIEWNKVANRVLKMKDVLRKLIEDPGDDMGDDGWAEGSEDDWEIPFRNKKTTQIQKQKGPKANSIFWNEVIQEIKEKGSRVVAGVRGQFANFEKAQPGYYGEQGSVIIHQRLYDMFPPSSLDASLIAPLTGNEFMEKILVPEVALRLIMEDRRLKGDEGKQEALTVLRESASYGVFMFPEDGGEWGGRRKTKDNQLGVGDMIVMQRAMKRRKELEEEGEESITQSEQEREGWRRTDRRDKEAGPTRPKPRPLGKASSSTTIISSSQSESARMEVNKEYEDIIKTPMPARRSAGLEDDETPNAPRPWQTQTTPPLMRARRRHNKELVRQNYGTLKAPLPTRIHLNQTRGDTLQDSRWLLEDESL